MTYEEKLEVINKLGWEVVGPHYHDRARELYAVTINKSGKPHFWSFGNSPDEVISNILAEVEKR